MDDRGNVTVSVAGIVRNTPSSSSTGFTHSGSSPWFHGFGVSNTNEGVGVTVPLSEGLINGQYGLGVVIWAPSDARSTDWWIDIASSARIVNVTTGTSMMPYWKTNATEHAIAIAEPIQPEPPGEYAIQTEFDVSHRVFGTWWDKPASTKCLRTSAVISCPSLPQSEVTTETWSTPEGSGSGNFGGWLAGTGRGHYTLQREEVRGGYACAIEQCAGSLPAGEFFVAGADVEVATWT